MRLRLFFSILFCVLLLSAVSPNASADTFNVSWSGAYGDGSGTITATDEGSGQFLVTSLDATQAGLTLSLLPSGTYGANDNDVYPSQSLQLDFHGLAFSDGSFSYNIYGNPFTLSYFECISSATDCQVIGEGVPIESFQITPTPEPGSLLLLASGFAGLAALRRKRSE